MTRGSAVGWLRLTLSLLSGVVVLGAVGTAAAAAEAPGELTPPSIAGLARDGQRMKAVKGDWSGERPIAYSYSWSRCDEAGEACAPIPSATHPARKATHEDVGHTLRVTVTVADAGGQSSDTSAPSEVVAPAALRKGKAPSISGSPRDGQLLTVGGGSWKGTPPQSYSYEWQSCPRGATCTSIPGAEGAGYRAASSQIGSRLRVIVTATNDVGSLSVVSKRTKPILAGAPVNTGAPSIAGSLQEGQTLTADAGQWAGTGPISFSYQWLRCSLVGGGCEEVPGAQQAGYTASGLDLAHNLAVVVTAQNAQGAATATSAETQPILGILPTDGALPSISGLLQDGGLLSVASGTWSGTEPISFSYEWQVCNALGEACKAIEGATGTSLKLDSGEIGKTLDVLVTATNVAGSRSVTTPVTGLIAGILPNNRSLPEITGVLQDGRLLSAGSGSWSGSEPISYAYQWELCNALGKACEGLSGATGMSFALSPTDIGKTLAVVVTATNAAGSVSATSAVTGPIAGILPKNTAAPTVSGILKGLQTVTATTGSWSGSEPISYTYQWQLCGVLGNACLNIAKATGASFPIPLLDVGNTLRVIVTATNVAGSVSQPSAVSGLIAGL